MGSAGLRALVVLSDASCVGRESLHACCEFAGIDALLVKKKISQPGFEVRPLRCCRSSEWSVSGWTTKGQIRVPKPNYSLLLVMKLAVPLPVPLTGVLTVPSVVSIWNPLCGPSAGPTLVPRVLGLTKWLFTIGVR